jgi:predicted ATPase
LKFLDYLRMNYLRCRVDSELKLGLLAIVDGETLHEQRGESRSGTTTEGVEDEEALKTGALVSQLTDAVEDNVDDLLANGVVATSVVVGGILLAGDQLLRVEELTVSSATDLICNMDESLYQIFRFSCIL